VIDESVDLLGFLFEIKTYEKITTGIYLIFRGFFFRITKISGKKAAYNGLIDTLFK